MSKMLTLAATVVVGLVLGAGIGVAAADQDDRPNISEWSQNPESMDEMHDTMRDQMPVEVRQQCDEVHDAMADGDHASMMGSMGSTMSGMGATTPEDHAEHHPETEG